MPTFARSLFLLAVIVTAAYADWDTQLDLADSDDRLAAFGRVQRSGFSRAERAKIVEQAVAGMSPEDADLLRDATNWILFHANVLYRRDCTSRGITASPSEALERAQVRLDLISFVQRTPRKILESAIELRVANPEVFSSYNTVFPTSPFAGLSVVNPILGRKNQPPLAQNFLRIRLPLGVSIEAPANWRLLGGDESATIATSAEAALRQLGFKQIVGQSVTILRANSMPRSTYASIEISAADSEVSAEEILKASSSELREIQDMLELGTRKLLAVQNSQLVRAFPLERASISNRPAIVFRYLRTGSRGPVMVSSTILYLGKTEMRFRLSYRENEGGIWSPVVQHMHASIRVGG